MPSTRKHPSVLSYLFNPYFMGVGVVVIGVYFGIQQEKTVEIVKQLPTITKAKVFCDKPVQGTSVEKCVDDYVALEQFVSVLKSEIAAQSLNLCFAEQHKGNPVSAWQCLQTNDGKPLHKQYKSPLLASKS